MKFWLLAMLIPASALASDLPLSGVIKHLKSKGKLQSKESSPATSATGFETQQSPAQGKEVEDARTFRIIRSDKVKREGSKIDATGGFEFTYKGYHCRAIEVHGDLVSNLFTFVGDVEVYSATESYHGERMVVNFDQRTVAYENSSLVLQPKQLGGYLREPLYLKGASGGGSSGAAVAGASTITTCNLDHPHYFFDVRKSDIKPGQRAILRDVGLTILGREILRLPLVYIPLDQKIERFTPEVGNTRDEGYYIKNVIAIPVRGNTFVNAHTDYFSRLGPGLGGDLHYNSPGIRGLLRAYELPTSHEGQLYSVDHYQNIFGGKFRLEGNWIKNNYLTAPGTRYYTLRSRMNWETDLGSIGLNATRNGNKSKSFGSYNETFSFQHENSWTKKLRTNLTTDYSVSSSNSLGSVTTQRKQVNIQFSATQDLDRVRAQFDYRRLVPVGAQSGFLGSSDQTPMLTLSSDSRKLFGPKKGGWFPFQADFSAGELTDSLKKRPITRYALNWSANKSLDLAKAHHVDYSTRFKQGIYSDNTAQYVLGTDLGYKYKFGEKNYIETRWNYLHPFGFSPLNMDRVGESDEIFTSINTKPHKSLSIGAQTSYDFLQIHRKQTPWQTVGFRSEWTPNDKLLMRMNANYDAFNQVWSNVRLDSSWKAANGFISLGTRFDGQRHTFGNFNLLADGITWKRLKLSTLLSYNGYSKKFEATQFSFTYDLHCAEAILQIIDNKVGFRSGRQISLFIRLKALPFDTPFGIGRRGQGLGTGTGFGF